MNPFGLLIILAAVYGLCNVVGWGIACVTGLDGVEKRYLKFRRLT